MFRCLPQGPEGDRSSSGHQIGREPTKNPEEPEILSPEDRISRMQERIDDYLAFGVSYVWVIDPKTRRAWVHTPTGISEVKDGVLRTRKKATLPRLSFLSPNCSTRSC